MMTPRAMVYPNRREPWQPTVRGAARERAAFIPSNSCTTKTRERLSQDRGGATQQTTICATVNVACPNRLLPKDVASERMSRQPVAPRIAMQPRREDFASMETGVSAPAHVPARHCSAPDWNATRTPLGRRDPRQRPN